MRLDAGSVLASVADCLNWLAHARKAGLPFRSHLDILRDAPERTRAFAKPLQLRVTLNGKPTHVEPDALFAIGNHAYALEADRSTKSIIGVFVPKILAYREIVANGIAEKQFGIDSLYVLFATDKPKRMHNITKELERIAKNGRSTMFGFRAEENFGAFLQVQNPAIAARPSVSIDPAAPPGKIPDKPVPEISKPSSPQLANNAPAPLKPAPPVIPPAPPEPVTLIAAQGSMLKFNAGIPYKLKLRAGMTTTLMAIKGSFAFDVAPGQL